MKYIFALIPALLSFVFSASAQDGNVPDIKNGDVIKKGSFTVLFSKASAEKIPPPYSDQALREKMTKDIGNWQNRAEKVEEYLAKKTEGKYFKRSGRSLTLFLENNRQLVLTDQGAEEDENDNEYEGYNFEHFFEKNNFYLIYVQYYEGSAYMLVNRKTGAKEYIIGIPYFSPSGKKILAINIDLEAAFDTNGIQLLTLKGDTLRSEFLLEPSTWGPTAAKWLSENEVLLEKQIIRYEKSSSNIAGYKKGYSKMTIK